MKVIQTAYKGYLFRSRLEARWAVFFDACGIEWEYEPEGLMLNDGTCYLPDFYLSDFNCYFEVKRKSIMGTDEAKEAIRKIRNGCDCNSWAGIISFGDPMDENLHIFCQETDDVGGGEYHAPVIIGSHPDTGEPCLFSYTDRRDRNFFTKFDEDMPRIPMLTSYYGTYQREDFLDAKIRYAQKLARQARFEHGETPRSDCL